MATRARAKLNVKQVAAYAGPGVLSDGGGLYLRVRESGRSWFYIGTLNGKRIEIGLGSALDVTLAKARDKAAEVRALILEGIDPRIEKAKAKAAAKPKVLFGAFALDHLDSIEDGFKNPKHRQQWRNTLITYAKPMFDLPIEEVKTEHILEVLQPIWLEKRETASRVRGRIERVLDAARVKGLRHGENPARGRGHLDLLLPKRSKVGVKHHPALPFKQVAEFMAELRQRDIVTAKALEWCCQSNRNSSPMCGVCPTPASIQAMSNCHSARAAERRIL
ncbi:tyrosine-type recombinase/integrase [Alteraurantiacibacter buctensis]|uniref:Integrase arm-type DNA-binding domain-containing protein n=1 Tax=Alteraurantiacibacter buctensis TaxID=1503981 RepID=A0A844YR44_9SPHN|nr:integrase arm-type DNA-binding domain-containing protein [Alteraurantiacibacter buctensis]MXO70039.1 integrase arm-type DNA-binding domain-containing protein [Alteraurantiacibacter buctensis]